ncbi:LysR family transcriptional regulator [Alcaligenes parafaecalis]|uniref:LysR family transcriptional regulator n=1 Tax=Alcaligenes parafaecalis TaxID=171260 RepID=A0ABT3VNA6_9BURK|nr:LysR family transcriptional regulator [Alcaligenes parafaecalis]MCX5463735.1 LysR family transcriptional regulator [Alcaligenes parafaecalis]
MKSLQFGMVYNLNELRAFLAVVETGSLGRAADKMNLTQPALSRIIKRLEEAVGEPLFERHSGGMRLTAFGTALAPHAQTLSQEEQIARNEMNRLRGLATGVLRIGVTAGTSAIFAPTAIAAYLDRWPGIEIEVTEGIWNGLVEKLENYHLDLLIAPETIETERTVAGDEKWSETMRVVVGAQHPLLSRPQVTMEDLLQERWCFVPKNTEPHNRLMALFLDEGLSAPTVTVSSLSIPLLKSLVTQSGFISWLGRPMYLAELQAGMVQEIMVEGMNQERRFSTYYRRFGRLPGPALKFLDEIQNLINKKSVKT